MYMPKSAIPLQQSPSQTPQTGYMPKTAIPVQPEKKSLSGFIGNVGKSAVKAVADVGQAIAHPIQTGKALYGLGSGVVSKFIPGRQQSEQNVDNLVGAYKEKYKGGLLNTLYNDPVGVALDASTVLGGAGAALRGAGTVGKVAGLTKAGSTLSKVGSAIDPLAQTGKVVGAVTRPIKPLFSKAVSSAADFLGSKAQKFNRTDIEAIKSATGMSPLEYARTENLPIAATTRGADEAKTILSGVQKEYNDMVRKGATVSRQDYVKAIKQEAQNVLNSGDTPSNRAIAQKLLDEAKYQASKKTPMTDEFLADTKTSAFSQASKNQINNPMVSGVEEKLGRAGVETLEKVAPGSKAAGKRLRGLREYSNRLEAQANTGKGTQFFNLLKPVGAGALAGAGLGSFAPGIGNLTGLVVGATASAIANSPQFLSFASRSLTGLSKAKLPAGYSKLFSRVIDAGKAGRMFTPTSQETQLIESLRPQLEQKKSSPSIIPEPYQVPQIRRPNGR